jgi:quercetin dioxygenase-like cupin family protein
VLRQSRTVTGQTLELPAGPSEMVVSVRDLPPGGLVPMHRHRWQRYAYVKTGRIRMTVGDTGLVREFGPGEIIVEPRGQWHEGRVVGDTPVRLIVLDQVPPGQSNMELKDPR